MEIRDGVTRRQILLGVAAAAGAATLAGCTGSKVEEKTPGESTAEPGKATASVAPDKKGSLTTPIKPPGTYQQAPMLEALVKAGTLPPLEKRLPESPYVPPHRWLEVGKYGGKLKMIVDETDSSAIKEYCYGHSLLRFLNDGLDIGPGLVETWEVTPDAMKWTFHFRKGLKWSDGHDWSTEDIMYWWEDLALNTDHPEQPPDDVRSGKDTLAKVTAQDATTLVLTFDAPAPATAERLAAWVNRGVGPWWMQPKHYVKQFHPKYNKAIDAKKDWYTQHDLKADWAKNPEAPTMTGWKLKSYQEGVSVVLERNPYYWCVDSKGNQLPYIDEVVFTRTAKKIQMLAFTQGKVDYAHGGHHPLVLADFADLQDNEERTKVRVRFWDSGSGSGSMLFWNYDHPDAELRKFIRDKRFRRALSHAFDRKRVRKSLYYDAGELSSGTLSPKGLIFAKDDEAKKRYVQWRDAFVSYDKDKANKLLDDVGLGKKDAEGKRLLPSGKPIVMELDYPSDADNEHIQKNNLLKADWEAVGISVRINPVNPDGFGDIWGRGELMTTTAWEIGDNHPLIYPGWVVPVQTSHWAPLHGQGFLLKTTDPKKLTAQAKTDPWKRTPPFLLPDKGSPIDRLWTLYAQARIESDQIKRAQLLWEICKVHIDDGPFFLGSVANYPRMVLVRDGLHNVPAKENLALGGWVNPWILPSPAVYDPETYFWDSPEQHA